MKKTCLKCSLEYVSKYHTQKYCSRKCSLEISNEKYRSKSKHKENTSGFFCWSEYAGGTVIV